MSNWLGRLLTTGTTALPPAPPVVEPNYRDCGIQGHHFEGRYDEEPTFEFTADDVLKFQGSRVETRTKDNKEIWQVVSTPQLRVQEQIALIEATKKKTYVAEVCRYCGKTIRYDREDPCPRPLPATTSN